MSNGESEGFAGGERGSIGENIVSRLEEATRAQGGCRDPLLFRGCPQPCFSVIFEASGCLYPSLPQIQTSGNHCKKGLSLSLGG